MEMLTTVVFAEGRTGTRVTLTWTPLNATEIELRTFAANMVSMNGGWTSSFDELGAFFARA
nr:MULTISPECIES: SRPBCC domain-containing protein [unclassified Acidisoma]